MYGFIGSAHLYTYVSRVSVAWTLSHPDNLAWR